MQDDLHGLLRDIFDGRGKAEIVFFGNAAQLLKHNVFAHFAQRSNADVVDAFGIIGNDAGHVHRIDGAESVAGGAGAVGRVEGEGIGRRLFVRQAVVGIHEVLAEGGDFFGIGIENKDEAVAGAEGGLQRGGDAVAAVVAHFEAVHYQFDVVYFVAVHLQIGHQLADFAVNAHFGIALFAHLLEEFAVVAFAPPHQRRQHNDFMAVKEFHNALFHLVFGVAHHFFAADVRVRLAGAGKEQAQEIVYFSDGAHRGARIATGGFLFDGNNGTEAGNLLYIRAFHLADELAGIRRKGFHVAALPLGINGIEGQRGLAAAADAGDDDELITGNAHVHIAQVVYPRAGYFNTFFLCAFFLVFHA